MCYKCVDYIPFEPNLCSRVSFRGLFLENSEAFSSCFMDNYFIVLCHCCQYFQVFSKGKITQKEVCLNIVIGVTGKVYISFFDISPFRVIMVGLASLFCNFLAAIDINNSLFCFVR